MHWHVQGEKNLVVPEDIGKQAAYALLEEVQRGGVCDSMHQVSLPAPYSLSMCACSGTASCWHLALHCMPCLSRP